MRLTYTRVLFVVALLALSVFSLRPEPEVDHALEVATSPLRYLAEIAAPFRWLNSALVRAAEESLAAADEAERAERALLFTDEWRFALPVDPQLCDGRRFVRGEVLGRRAKNADQVEVELESASTEGIEVGAPVTSGDAYVGRVASIEPEHPGRVWVELITDRSALIGAVATSGDQPAGVRMVVGGVTGASRNSERAFLAVHHPEHSELERARVRVDETWSRLEPFAKLSKGFLLGDLERDSTGTLAVRPRLEYSSGLFHVAVVLAANAPRRAERPRVDELDTDHWVGARVLSSSDPATRRHGLVISAGSADGVCAGAAVVFGTRLVGRVASVARWSSKVALLGDAGFQVHSVARLADIERPALLGSVTSQGLAADDGALVFIWDSPRELEIADASVDARLFTGSGDRLVPRGLILGRAYLPAQAREPLEIRLRESVDGASLAELRVYVPETTEDAP